MRSASTSRIAFALVAFLARTTCAFNLYAPTSTFASFRSGRYSSHVQQRLGVSGLHSSSSGLEAGQPVPDERSASVRKGLGGYRIAGPDTPTPSFAQTDRRIFNKFAIQLFRNGMVNAIGEDVRTPGYSGLMELALKLNRRFSPGEARRRTRKILASFFPPFILKLFPIMFSSPFPSFSAKLNAAITAITCRWLMGPIEVVDVPASELAAGWGDGVRQGLQVERCRFLEESGCASVCINICKVPTQDFFIKDMGIPLSMEPDYETFQCQFKFGKAPIPQALPSPALCGALQYANAGALICIFPQAADEVFLTPCFQQCPSKGRIHAANDGCDALMQDGAYDATVPTFGDYWDAFKSWVDRKRDVT